MLNFTPAYLVWWCFFRCATLPEAGFDYAGWAADPAGWSVPHATWAVHKGLQPVGSPGASYKSVSLRSDGGLGIVTTGPFAHWPVTTGGLAAAGRRAATLALQDNLTTLPAAGGDYRALWGDAPSCDAGGLR